MPVREWTGASSSVFAATGNWSPATIPVNGDDVYFDQLAVNVTGVSGAVDESAITLLSLNAKMTNLYPIGGDLAPLKIKSTTVNIGDQSSSGTDGTGSGRINLDLSTAATTINIKASSTTPADTGKEPVRIKCNNAANVANLSGGRTGFATDAIGDTATLGTINVTGSGAIANLSAGVTLGALNQSDGTVRTSAAITNLSYDGGALITEGSNNIPTMEASGANAVLNHRRAATTVTISRSSQLVSVAWTAHGLAVGDQFIILGADQVQYNGVRIVATVPDANTVTFYVNGTPTSPATGTITASLMAITNLYLFDGAILDVSQNASAFGVGFIYLDGDAQVIVNPANPNHFAFGYLSRNRGTLTTTA